MDLLLASEAVVLPEREALSFLSFQGLSLNALNSAISSQTLTSRSSSHASAGQVIVVNQG